MSDDVKSDEGVSQNSEFSAVIKLSFDTVCPEMICKSFHLLRISRPDLFPDLSQDSTALVSGDAAREFD